MAAHYGVTVDDINVNVLGVTITAATSPNTTQVESWIRRHAGIVDGIFEAKDIDPDTIIVDGPGYSYGAEIVIQRVCAQLLLATQGQFEVADAYRKEATRMLKRLEEWAPTVGNDAASDDGSVDLISSSSTEAMQARINAKPLDFRTASVRIGKL